MSEPRLTETADPDEAFGALSNATRVAILRALWDADGQTATFSELRDAVGMADSGQFNYHLDKLTGRFVTKTDDGYELTLAGMAVNGAIHAGAYTMAGSTEPLTLEEPCPTCGGERTFHYEDERVRVTCDGCELTVNAPVPPGVFAGYDRDAMPEVAAQYFRTIFQQLRNGFCWVCEGRVVPTVSPMRAVVDDPDSISEERGDVPFVEYECQRCGAGSSADVQSALQDHPAVVAFHHDHGVDVRERPPLTLSSVDTDHGVVESTDPLRARVSYEADGATLELVVDGDLTVVGTDRDDG
ncbi:ArsR/SmtB family transcription factor [Haloarcula litorea]|uniref:ArsR/SmtB family transcription factor n=1 Tax=Haloarcula litorea TaxID=3032579 RepID=UPI0023E842A8|nr:helix-turn-helix domain-containing protein [Halomicroarcula sp. GDY20]